MARSSRVGWWIVAVGWILVSATGCPEGSQGDDDTTNQTPGDDDTSGDDDVTGDDDTTGDDDDNSGDDDTDPGQVEALIGPEGGALEHPDGARVEIPEGALSDETLITIVELSEGDVELPPGIAPDTGIFDFGPDGLQFDEDVLVTLTRRDGGEETAGALLFYWHEELEGWRILHTEDDREEFPGGADAESIWSLTRHFTPIVGWRGTLGPAVTLTSTNGYSAEVHDIQNCTFIARALRNAADIEGVVVHSTAGLGDVISNGCYLMDRRSYDARCVVAKNNCPGGTGPCVAFADPLPAPNDGVCSNASSAGAHFVIDRDGVIGQLGDPDNWVPHVASTEDCAAGRPNNDFLIGIELVNASAGPVPSEPYSGAQMAALVELSLYLVDEYGMDPPNEAGINAGAAANADTWSNHVGVSVVFHRQLEGCRPAAQRHIDPAGPFQETAMWDAIEDAIPPGQIQLLGGDAWGAYEPGDGGQAWFEQDAATQPAEQAVDLLVAAGASSALGAGTHVYNDVIVDGTLTVDGDVTIQAFGTFYVGADGLIEGQAGTNLTVEADGLALITGQIALNGEPGYVPLDPANFGLDQGACQYDVDGGVEGPGEDAGDFMLSSGRGPLYIPTVVTLGGDANVFDPEVDAWTGGSGGDFIVVGGSADIHFHGSAPAPITAVQGANALDYHPTGCDLSGHLDSAMQPNQPQIARGAVTSGGTGPRSNRIAMDAEVWGHGAAGGSGGDVTISGTGRLWFHDWDVATGSGVDYLTINPFLGSIDEQAHFAITLGGLGGGGGQGVAAEGGDGGEGGAAGDVDIQGTSNAAAGTDNDYVYGWNGDNGGTLSLNASPSVIGDLAIYLDDAGAEQLRVCAVGGSGGGPGGTISGHPGWFGDAGTDGTVAVVLTP